MGTGQEIPDPPKYINFCRGDLNDTSSEVSEEESYSVAQFQRTINPAYRSSSPQPSTYESHHDPQSELAIKMNSNAPPTPTSREATVTPQKQPQKQHPKPPQSVASVSSRKGGHIPPNYQPSQHGDIPTVPHNEYPTDGMTMFCRTGPPSEKSSAASIHRPASRDSHSDSSNPTSFSSVEPPPPSAKQAPVKPTSGGSPPADTTPGKQVQKKRSAFFSNSPFRRKSKHEKDRQATQGSVSSTANRNTWASSRQFKSITSGSGYQQQQQQQHQQSQTQAPPQPQLQPQLQPQPQKHVQQDGTPEPVDPRANFQLNVGNNVFDVASPDASRHTKSSSKNTNGDLDPIAQALADLKGVGKQASVRVSADRYHGIPTPAPPQNVNKPMADTAKAAAQRGTPPPAYNDSSARRLDAPSPAFTASQMQKTTRKYVGQTQEMLHNNSRSSQRVNAPEQAMPRATSPAPAPRRSASPQPSVRSSRQSHYGSVNKPSPSAYQSSSMNSRYRQSPSVTPTKVSHEHSFSPQYSRHNSPSSMRRSVSPQPQFMRQERPESSHSTGGMELQLSSSEVGHHSGVPMDNYGTNPRGRSSTIDARRPMSMYYGQPDGNSSQALRTRSRSIATADNRQLSRDGRPVLHFGKFQLL